MAIGPGLHIEDPTDPSLDLTMSEGARPVYDQVRTFIADEVEPITLEFHRLGAERSDHWGYHPGQMEILDGLKTKAREVGPGTSSSRMPRPERASRTWTTPT